MMMESVRRLLYISAACTIAMRFGWRMGGVAMSFSCWRDYRTAGLSSEIIGSCDMKSPTCNEPLHVLFLDLDNGHPRMSEPRTSADVQGGDDWNLKNVTELLHIIQERFDTSDFFLFRTLHGFHAICIDVFTETDVLMIHRFADLERSYDAMSVRRGYWVLRFAAKGKSPPPRFVGVIQSEYGKDAVKSRPHASWLIKGYPESAYRVGIMTENCQLVGGSKVKLDEYGTVI
jgi:hypothetical protein